MTTLLTGTEKQIALGSKVRARFVQAHPELEPFVRSLTSAADWIEAMDRPQKMAAIAIRSMLDEGNETAVIDAVMAHVRSLCAESAARQLEVGKPRVLPRPLGLTSATVRYLCDNNYKLERAVWSILGARREEFFTKLEAPINGLEFSQELRDEAHARFDKHLQP